MNIAVEVIDRQRARRVATGPLGRFVRRLSRAKRAKGFDSVTVCLVSDRAMAALNRRFLGKDGTTDVLSFPGDQAPPPAGPRHLGDIVISVPQAERQARAAGHLLARELRILVTHGWLHLLGYDHETDDGRMLRLQRRLLGRLLGRARSS